MQKILRKRIGREFCTNIARYLALSLLIVLSMYLIVSMIGAAETIIRGGEVSDEQQKIEDGEFSLFVPMKDSEWEKLNAKGITLEKMFSMDYRVGEDKMLRLFQNRKQINTIRLKEGRLASGEDEIVLERRFAEVNHISVEDTIELGDHIFRVTGIGTVPDYNNVLKSLGDTGCDSKHFGIAFVTEDTYTKLRKENNSTKSEEYYYAYRLNDKMTDQELKEELEKLEFSKEDVADVYFQEYWDRTMGKKDELLDGINELLDGATSLKEGLVELTDNNGTLNKATGKLLDSYLKEANHTLGSYGVAELTIDNYEQVLEQQIAGTDNAILRMSYSNLLEELKQLAAYEAGVKEYTEGTEDAEAGAKELEDGVRTLRDDTEDIIDTVFQGDVTNLLMFLTASDNVRIKAAAGDQELYRSVGMLAGVIVLILISYVLSVFVVHSIDRESAMIGALYALGVKKRTLLLHYTLLPTILAFISGVTGTLLGYSAIGVPIQMQDCYAYYSLPDLKVVVMPYLFVYGIIIPPLVSIVVNGFVIRKRLSKPVLSLLKKEQKAAKGKNVKLQNTDFMHLFRIRQMIRESRTGFTVVFGMFVSLLLTMMALEIYVYCRNVNIEYVQDTKYDYMYTYKYPSENPPEGGYKAYAKTMKKEIYGYKFDITVLGITEDNPFFDVALEDSSDKVTISSSIAYKYGLSTGDTFTLEDEENNRLYGFEIVDVTQYAPSFTVFMPYEKALDLFDEPEDYYNVIFSDHALDIESGRLYATTTREDIKKAAGIFSDMMQSMILLLGGVSVLIFVVVLYLMMKVMIDRSTFHIALIKIFGYRDKEVKKMYLDGNLYIIIIGALLSIPLAKWIMDISYEPMFVPNISCGVNKSFSWWMYVAIFVSIVGLYFIINHLLVGRIYKMVPAEVLKCRE